MKPVISIIVPVYNVEKYLERCLNSLVHQSLEDIEIIVVNDGSLDQSEQIIHQFERLHPEKIKAFKKENGGLGDARNFGLPYAQADYIAFIDSDDYVELDMFEKMYQKASEQNADLVVCDIEYVWENSERKHLLKGLNTTVNTDVNKALFLSPIFAWNKLYRKSLFNKLNLKYPPRLWYEDLPVSLPYFTQAKTVAYVNEALVHYVQRSNSIMNSKSSKKMFDIFTILEDVFNQFQRDELFKPYHDELEYVFIEQLYLYGAFRFMRSNDVYKLFAYAKKLMNSRFPHWHKNKYIKFLPLSYRFYLSTLGTLSLPIYTQFIRLKSKGKDV